MTGHSRHSQALILIALALAAGAVLNGCHSKPKGEGQADKPPVTVAPLGFSHGDADAQVALSLPDGIKVYPTLHTQLYNEGEQTLKAFMAQAHKDRAQQKADGIDVPAYSHTITWKIAGQNPRLLSLFSEEDDYQGGAHPSNSFQVRLWDKRSNALVPVSSLLASGADLSAVDAYVCHQVEAERSKREGTPTTQANSGFSCPKFADSRLILIPAQTGDKFGAIDVLYAPYEVGPYSEGTFEIRVPQNLLKGAINPDYADQFGGEPVKDMALSSLGDSGL